MEARKCTLSLVAQKCLNKKKYFKRFQYKTSSLLKILFNLIPIKMSFLENFYFDKNKTCKNNRRH